MRALLLLLAIVLAACTSPPIRPVEIEAADMCAYCRMVISEKRYAAELVGDGGDVFKFDDIGCMIHFAQQRGWINRPPARFVRDFDSAEWLEAGRASFVHSPEIHSPMVSGLLAVRDPGRAEQYAARFHGRVRSLDDLWK